ncbi:MAG: hypothetical protein K9M02_09735 [Thiohalocapsa sp.]|nr:hypothetical protein [Thiohalocapsa sp.]
MVNPASRSKGTRHALRAAALLLLGSIAGGQALGWSAPHGISKSAPQSVGDAQRPADRRLAQNYNRQSYNPWQFRPVEPNNARGQPPAPRQPMQGAPAAQVPPAGPPGSMQYPQAGYPGGQPAATPYAPRQFSPQQFPQGQYPPGQYGAPRYPGGGYPGYAGRSGSMQPRLEVELSDDTPYVQENVLVRLRVVSSGNLATASPEVAGFDEVLVEQVSGPDTSSRSGESGREIVNEFVLAVTPLRHGEIEVGPMAVEGTLAGGAPFTAKAAQPLRLRVRPATAGVLPWLPLESLTLNLSLDEGGVIEEGRPVTLTLLMQAHGALGEQLPSLERMLSSEDFRVYREQTLVDTTLVDGGRRLLGKRTDYYTLVPHSGGRLHLPELRVNWWNVQTASRETSSEPIRTFSVAGESGPFGFGRSVERTDSGDWRWVWMPLAGLALVLAGYWGGVWWRSRPGSDKRGKAGAAPGPRVRTRLREAASAIAGSLAMAGSRLDPRPLLSRGLALYERLTPKSTRVYRCAVAAETAPDPATWATAFQTQACRQLRTPEREPLPKIADRLLQLRPGADGERIRTLMQELDNALYNGRDIDFKRWKKNFRRALRPGTGTLRSMAATRMRRGRLPALNPRPRPS